MIKFALNWLILFWVTVPMFLLILAFIGTAFGWEAAFLFGTFVIAGIVKLVKESE
jgi:uncharacterized membrane protein AbrB (regulator of aidB expression)